jgi:hypothetical protein
MFQLQISDVDATSGSIPVSWCLDAETLKLLADEKVRDPQIIICVAPVNTEEDPLRYRSSKEVRKVVPLKDLMTYVEFRTSGPNRIWGLVSFKSKKEAKDYYLDKKDGSWNTSILNSNGDDYARWLLETETEAARLSKEYTTMTSPINVDVPAGVFAPEPAAWEKAWVNHFFKDKVVDQCHFRKRRLFAYGLQPLIALSYILIRLLFFLFGALTLCRGLTFKYVLHPFVGDMADALFDQFSKGSILIFHQPEDDDYDTLYRSGIPKPGYLLRSFWLMPLMPAFWLLPAIFLLTNHLGHMAFALGVLFLVGVVLMLASVIEHYGKNFLGNAFYILMPIVWLVDWLAKDRSSGQPWYLEQHETELIICAESKKPLTFKSVPSHHKTIRLRFQDLKSKVCKPFSL